ncbi:MAG: selenoprotein B, partial [Stellaceae bacterium]
MSALGHYLEEAGIASVAIALIRPQAEHTRPPRALWVPFELGRPIGPPGNASFQRRVISGALGMLAADKTASLIADFPDDDPRETPDPAWQAPSARAPGGAVDGAALADELEAELRALAPAYAQSCT